MKTYTLVEVYEHHNNWVMSVEVDNPASPLDGQVVDSIIDSTDNMTIEDAYSHAYEVCLVDSCG